ISIAVVNDTLDEDDETIQLAISSPTNATLGAITTHTYTILDDDPPPSLSINNVTVTEGNSGTTNANFTVTLSAASGRTVTVNYATVDATATAPSDYVAIPTTTLTFNPGQTTRTVSVPVIGDTITELNETFVVSLSNPTNATIDTATGTATILNDDAPSLSINDANVVEGNSSTANAIFTVSLSAPSDKTVTVSYATADGTASAGSDYVAQSGTLTFPPGATNKTIIIAVSGDSSAEFNETFFVNLSNPVNATIADGQGLGTIRSDDFIALFQGQSFGDPTWFGGPQLGWKEREYVPLRLVVSGGPATNQFFSVDFDHTKLSG